MGISLHFAEAPTKEGGENSTGLLRTKWGKVYKALSCYSDWHCIHSVNVSCCLYYYPSLITVPSSNNPFPLYLCIVFTQKVLPTRADKSKASLLLKAHFNQWPFPRDLPWPSRHTAVSPFSPSLSPSPEHTSSLHFANWKSIRHWASVPPVCQGNNPLLSWLQAQKTSHERGCLLNHNMCTQSCLNSRLRNFIWCLRRMNFPISCTPRPVVLQVESSDPWGTFKPLSGDPRGQNYFHNTHLLFIFSLCWRLHSWCKSNAG